MHAAAKIYEECIASVTTGEPVKPITLRWDADFVDVPILAGCLQPSADAPGYPLYREAEFDSPGAKYMPEESKVGNMLFIWRTGKKPPSKIAIHLPTTGDQYFWYRKQLAKDLLKHDVASCIPMFPYYGKRKPHGQYLHLLTSVSALITQVCGGIMEAAGIAAWANAAYPGAKVVMTGVSLGGSVANVAAVITAGNCDTSVGSCPVVATSSATSFLTGVLHNRIAWNVLSEAEDAVADEIKAVVAASLDVGEKSKPVIHANEKGLPLTPTEAALADTMDCLSMSTMIRLMEQGQRSHGVEMPMLDAVTQVTARKDRFVGSHSDELHAVLRGLTDPRGECERVEVNGGHISTLFKRGETIVPAIASTFEKVASTLAARGGGAERERVTTPEQGDREPAAARV